MKMYKLIAQKTEDGPTPFYGYVVEDPNGNKVSGVTKAIITIDPAKAAFASMTFQRKWRKEDNALMEETVKNVPVDIHAVPAPSSE